MLKDFAWKTFELTGDIHSYFLYHEASKHEGIGNINFNNLNSEVSEEIISEIVMPGENTAN